MTRRPDRFAFLARAALLIGLVFAVTLPVGAQTLAGRIVGRIVDAETGRGIPDAGIQVVGTTMGSVSGVEGRYSLPMIPAGTVTIQVRLLGYQPKTVTGLQLDTGATLEQDISLSPATVQLETQVVTADVERGSVNAALDAQRNAIGIVNAITSEQIQKSPDGDAAQAVQRVSGVTVQDGKYVYVRGLGERYTTASLNGARIPSPEPEKRLVPLDLFPAGLLQTVTTSKTFTPDQPGDFSGASLEIRTREFPADRQIAYSASMGYNSAATGKSVLAGPRVGMEWAGFGGNERNLPSSVAATRGTIFYRTGPATNRLISSFRNRWSPTTATGTPNASFSASIGGSDPLFGRTLGYTASLSYSYNQEIRAGEIRGIPQGSGNGGAVPFAEWRGSTGRESVQWGGLLNLSTLVGGSTRLALNNTYTRSGDNEARFEEGRVEEFDEQRTVLRYIERSVRSNQLVGHHQVGARQELEWSVTSSGVTRVEPDRSTALYRRLTSDPQGTPFHLEPGRGGAERTFLDLTESNVSLGANYRVDFGDYGRAHFLKVGATWRSTDRGADNFSFQIFESGIPVTALELPMEQIFDGRFASPADSVFSMESVARAGSYTAKDRVLAGYAMMDFALTDKIHVIGGARVEAGDLGVTTELADGQLVPSTVQKTDVLPSLAFNVRPNDHHNVRVSVSQTLSRPEYRELSPTNVDDSSIGVLFQGNPNLRRTLIQNADARWEWYPRAGEVISVGVFYKRFIDPIERTEVNVSGLRDAAQQTVVNAEGANNYGVEVELRKGLGLLGPPFDGLLLFANATLMRSEIEIGDHSAGTLTSTSRAMVGQAPYVVNGGLTYSRRDGRASVTALYNVVGRRIVAASVVPLPDVHEEARHSLDLSLRMPLGRAWSVKLDAKNALDEPYDQRVGAVIRERYTTGRVVNLGLSWQQ
ncbi:MAG: TonB-dependent receptor domain-containing protein [Gemmatimonadaceae bacterium]